MKKIDKNEIMRLRDAGMTHQKIADTLHYSTATVKKVLDENGYISKFLTFERSTCKYPIYPKEIRKLRERLKVGDRIRAGITRMQDDCTLQSREEICTIIGLHPHFCLVEDCRGHRECILYVDLVMKERTVV